MVQAIIVLGLHISWIVDQDTNVILKNATSRENSSTIFYGLEKSFSQLYLLCGCIDSEFPTKGNANDPGNCHDSLYNSRRIQMEYVRSRINIPTRMNILTNVGCSSLGVLILIATSALSHHHFCSEWIYFKHPIFRCAC